MSEHDPERNLSSADAAAIRWAENHPDEDDLDHAAPSPTAENKDIVPNRHSASAEAASLRWQEQHDDE